MNAFCSSEKTDFLDTEMVFVVMVLVTEDFERAAITSYLGTVTIFEDLVT